MKRAWILFSVLFVATMAIGQTYEKDDVVLDSGGRGVANAIVRVCQVGSTGTPCTPLATIYSDAALAHPINQTTSPLVTDAGGNFQFFVSTTPSVDIQYITRGSYRTIHNVGLGITSSTSNSVTAQKVNGVLNPNAYAGSDIGAKINAAAADACNGVPCGEILIPSGYYDFSTPIVLTSRSGLKVNCASPGAILNYTPSSGVAVTIDGGADIFFGDSCMVTTTANSSTAKGLRVGGSSTFTTRVHINNLTIKKYGGTDYDTGFAVNIEIGGMTDGTEPVGEVWLDQIHSRGFTTAGFYIHHVVDLHVGHIQNYAPLANAAHAWGWIFDTGVSGVYASHVNNGASGTWIKNTLGTTASNGKPPQYFFIDDWINDSPYNPASWLFDDTLSSAPSGPGNDFYGYKFIIQNGWSSGCQLAGCNGIQINGGIDISFTNHLVRANRCHGVLLDWGTNDLTHGPVNFMGMSINDNNIDASTCDDYHVTAGTSNFSIVGGFAYGSALGDCCSATKYAVNIETGGSDNFIIRDLLAYGHQTGTITNGATGTHIQVCGLSDGTNTGTVCSTPFWSSKFYVDANFFWNITGGTPQIAWGANSYNSFNRGSNQWNWVANSTPVFYVNPTTFGIQSGITFTPYNIVQPGTAAAAGFARLIKTGTINWRNNANSGDNSLAVDGSDNLTYNGAVISTGTQVAKGSVTTTASASDNVSITGATASSHCTFSPTNASAATNIATTYISAKTTNQITLSHTATSGMTYDVLCTPN